MCHITHNFLNLLIFPQRMFPVTHKKRRSTKSTTTTPSTMNYFQGLMKKERGGKWQWGKHVSRKGPRHLRRTVHWKGSTQQKREDNFNSTANIYVDAFMKTDPKTASFNDQNTLGRPENGTFSFTTAHPLHSIEAQISFRKTKNNVFIFFSFASNSYIYSKIAIENEGSSFNGATTSTISTQTR